MKYQGKDVTKLKSGGWIQYPENDQGGFIGVDCVVLGPGRVSGKVIRGCIVTGYVSGYAENSRVEGLVKGTAVNCCVEGIVNGNAYDSFVSVGTIVNGIVVESFCLGGIINGSVSNSRVNIDIPSGASLVDMAWPKFVRVVSGITITDQGVCVGSQKLSIREARVRYPFLEI